MTLWAYLQAHDALFALAMIAAGVSVYAASRWLSSYLVERAIQHEIDAMNDSLNHSQQEMPPDIAKALNGNLWDLYEDVHTIRPPDPACGLMALHKAELYRIEQRRLRLVVRSSSRGL